MYTLNILNRISLLLVLVLVNACASTYSQTDAEKAVEPKMDSLVTAQWLNEHINDPDLVILDTTVIVEMDEKGFRNLSGKDNYNKAHIPTAGFADLMGELRDPKSSLDFALPTPEEFAAVMGALGVGDNSRVVLYSASYQAWPARVWWMLRWVGFDNVAILDGGLNAWKEAGLPISSEQTNLPAKQLTIKLRPELIADRDEVFTSINKSDVSIVDVLPDAHYIGEMVMNERAGHIPSAINKPDSNQFTETGQYRPIDELDMIYDMKKEQRSITYCGGGISASSVAFTMHRLGFTDVAVYIGSIQEWAADSNNPMTTKTSDDN